MADVTLHAKTTALLLQDLQHELIKGSEPVVPLSGAQLSANCQRLLAKARAVGMPVIYVRVSRRPDLKDAPRPPLGTPPGSGGGPSLIEGTDGAAIVAELAPRSAEFALPVMAVRDSARAR
jgi:nicotinamidase-related amidase